MPRRILSVAAAVLVAALAVVLGPAPAHAVTWGEIRNKETNLCLDAANNAGSGNGTRVQLWECTGHSNQKWSLGWVYINGQHSGHFVLMNQWSGRCLNADSSGGIYPSGARTQLWDCMSGHANAHWRTAGDKSHATLFTRAHNEFALDGDMSAGRVNGMKVQMWPVHWRTNQAWWCSVCP